jgi:hypothetical protein
LADIDNPQDQNRGFAMGLDNAILAVTAGSRNAVLVGYLCIAVRKSKPENLIISKAWTILEAANDLDNIPTVEACQRVIDSNLSGTSPTQSDINIIFDFF